MENSSKIIITIFILFLVLFLFVRIIHPFQPNSNNQNTNDNDISNNSNNFDDNNQDENTSELESKWLLPEDFDGEPAWGIKNGIIISSYPGDLGGIGGGTGGPKGLFRIYKDGSKGLAWVNFISIEPITTSNKLSQSEMESINFVPNYFSKIESPSEIETINLPSNYNNLAKITNENGVEQLNILFGIQEFNNGVKLYVIAKIRENNPEEVEFEVHSMTNSEPIKTVRLSSTAGNFNHLRLLWLDNEVIDSRELYSNYTGFDFAPIKIYDYSQIKKVNGALIALVTRNSDDVNNYWNEFFTRYKLTQYFKEYSGSYDSSCVVLVNGRYVFWKTTTPVPGGIAYENFELDCPFKEGQKLWFGATEKTPQELGF